MFFVLIKDKPQDEDAIRSPITDDDEVVEIDAPVSSTAMSLDPIPIPIPMRESVCCIQ